MGRKPSRQVVLVGVLLVLLVVLAYRGLQPGAATNESGPVRPAPAEAARAQTGALPEVKTAELEKVRPQLVDELRNPFVLRPAPPPPPPPRVTAPVPGANGSASARPDEPPPPPPPPPIPLKFIGIVDAPHGKRFAVLTDGRAVFHGREGEIVEGRYRVVRIGTEVIEIEYADGRGRQTIRLTGS
jgi:hypothetical protein